MPLVYFVPAWFYTLETKHLIKTCRGKTDNALKHRYITTKSLTSRKCPLMELAGINVDQSNGQLQLTFKEG